MPKGKAIYKDGSWEWYDDVEHRGDTIIIKTAYDHKVRAVGFGSARFVPCE